MLIQGERTKTLDTVVSWKKKLTDSFSCFLLATEEEKASVLQNRLREAK